MEADGSEVLLYIPPYRQDIEGPYIEDEYARLKTDLAQLAAAHNAKYADFQNVVPGPEWGTVTDDVFGLKEPDFMHFTAAGHVRFAQALDDELKRLGF